MRAQILNLFYRILQQITANPSPARIIVHIAMTWATERHPIFFIQKQRALPAALVMNIAGPPLRADLTNRMKQQEFPPFVEVAASASFFRYGP